MHQKQRCYRNQTAKLTGVHDVFFSDGGGGKTMGPEGAKTTAKRQDPQGAAPSVKG